jgi:hypothetical protein
MKDMGKMFLNLLPVLVFLTVVIYLIYLVATSADSTVRDLGKVVREVEIEFKKGYNDTL